MPAGGVVEAVRAVKEPGEVAAIRAAAALADEVYRRSPSDGLVGRTEREVAVGSSTSYAASVRTPPTSRPSSRRRSAGPCRTPSRRTSPSRGHARHARRRRTARRLLLRLHAHLGDGHPAQELLDAYELCLRAQRAALAALRPGMSGRDADAVARDLIAGAGLGERFGHSLGHGVGLDVHEDPRLSAGNERALEPGNVVTVEPGIYLPGRGGVRIEDLVVLTDAGAEVLGGLPTALTVVG